MANITRFDPFGDLARFDPFRGFEDVFRLPRGAMRGLPEEPPKILRTSRLIRPSFACVPTGPSASAPSEPPW